MNNNVTNQAAPNAQEFEVEMGNFEVLEENGGA